MKSSFKQPNCCNYEAWHEFVNMRIKIKKPMTDYAMRLAVDKLLRFQAQGYSITEMLNNSIFNNWQDFYITKDMVIKKENELAIHKVDGFKRSGKVIDMKGVADRLKQQGFLKRKA